MLKPETRCHAEKHACIEGTAQVSKVIPMLRPNVDFDLEGLDLLLADGPEDLLNIIISNMEVFLNQVVLRNWKDSIKAFQSCEVVLPHAGSLTLYEKRYLPGINRRQGTPENSSRFLSLSLVSAPSEDYQRLLLEAFDSLFPMLKGVASTRFLFGLLRTTMILNASPDCKSKLERCRFFIILYMEWQVLEMLTMENF
jgi:hypothetical protein